LSKPDQTQGGADAAAKKVAEAAKVDVKTVDAAWPLPKDFPEAKLKECSLVVRSKSDRGFRRGGFAFSSAETVLPIADLKPEQLEAITSERELIVSVRAFA
jgi:hypothetical protein